MRHPSNFSRRVPMVILQKFWYIFFLSYLSPYLPARAHWQNHPSLELLIDHEHGLPRCEVAWLHLEGGGVGNRMYFEHRHQYHLLALLLGGLASPFSSFAQCFVKWCECFLLTIKLMIIFCLTTASRMNTKGAPHWTKNYFFSHHNVTEEHCEGHIFRQKITFLSLNTNTNTYTNN